MKVLCQDFNWEVRKDMCKHLIKVSDYIGAKECIKDFFHEIVELVDDEENDVKIQGIKTFAKH